MIVAIERTKFTYLYKYNQIRVDLIQFIDKSTIDLKGMLKHDLNGLIELFNTAMPLFEQDHEIILLELDKNKINFQNGILISFDSIQCIYPLTRTGLQLLDGKINDDFILENPVFEGAIDALRLKRSMAFRRATSLKLLTHYNLDALLEKPILSLIESSVEKNLLDKSKPQLFNTFLDNLIAYNKTPSYIPDGNIEHICKIGAIAIKYLGKPEEVFTNGPFYKSSIKYKSQLNSPSLLRSYLDFNSIRDSELKSSIEKMVEIISKDYNDIDIFKVSFFFLAFKSFLNKHDNNIELLKNEIEELIESDKKSASFVLALLGYTFSIESIYEGLHKISNAPLLKSTQSKLLAEIEKRKRIDAEIEKQKELEKAAIEQEKISKSLLMQNEETKSEEVDNVKAKTDEIVIEEMIHKPVESLSETIVIYENSEKEEELEKASIEQEKISKSLLMQNEETKSELIENVAANTDEVVVDDSIHNRFETVSEPIDIYDNTKKEEESEKTSIEQENISVSQLTQNEKTKSEEVENIPANTDEVVLEELIHNRIETVSEPIDINENIEKKEQLERDNSERQNLEKIKSSIEPKDIISTEIVKETLTVQIFKAFLSKEYKAAKQKLWFELIDTYFPRKYDELSLEILLDKLDTLPEVKDKLLKAKKDKETIKSFFDTYS